MPPIGDPHLRRARALIDDTVAGLAHEALAWHEDGRWSTAEILDHLAKTYGGTAYIFRKCLADDGPKGRPPSVGEGLRAFVLLRLGYFPSGIKAPAMTLPDGLAPFEALDAARTRLAALDAVAAQCAERFGARARIANHPILGGLTVQQWRRFHWIHTRHHMRQILRLRRAAAHAHDGSR